VAQNIPNAPRGQSRDRLAPVQAAVVPVQLRERENLRGMLLGREFRFVQNDRKRLRLYEIPGYLEACSSLHRPLAEVLIACGLRISEALALTFRDVDFDAGTLRVLRSGKRVGPGSTKGDRFRSVDFGPRIDWDPSGSAGPPAGARDLQADGGVVRGRGGAVLERRYVSGQMHKKALRRASLRNALRLHDLRHTAAASWLACGLPLIYVQRQLGHASIKTTGRAYGRLEESYLRGP
jgi:integrase